MKPTGSIICLLLGITANCNGMNLDDTNNIYGQDEWSQLPSFEYNYEYNYGMPQLPSFEYNYEYNYGIPQLPDILDNTNIQNEKPPENQATANSSTPQMNIVDSGMTPNENALGRNVFQTMNSKSIEQRIDEIILSWNASINTVPKIVVDYYLQQFEIDPEAVAGDNIRTFLQETKGRNALVGAGELLKNHWERYTTVFYTLKGLSEKQIVWFTKGLIKKPVENSTDAMHFLAVNSNFTLFAEIPTQVAREMGLTAYADYKQNIKAEKMLVWNKNEWDSLQEKIKIYLRKNENEQLSLMDLVSLAEKISAEMNIKLSRDDKRQKNSLGLWYINNFDIIQPYLEGGLVHSNAGK